MRPDYTRLGEYLNHQSGSVDEVVLSFARIQELLSASLPSAALTDLGWWRKRGSSAQAALKRAGWQARAISRGLHGIRFTRRARRK